MTKRENFLVFVIGFVFFLLCMSLVEKPVNDTYSNCVYFYNAEEGKYYQWDLYGMGSAITAVSYDEGRMNFNH